MMIRQIIHKELTEFFRASTVVWLSAGVLVLMTLAVYNGYTYYTEHQKLTAEAQEITYEQFINQGDKNPHIGAHFGFYAFRPTPPMSLIESGVNDFTGNSFYLEPHKRGEVKFKESADATGLRRFGFLSIGYFTQFILPLFIFLITYSVFAKEWENGTIKILLSTRVRAWELYAGKLVTCLLIVLTLVAFIALAAGLILWRERTGRSFGEALPSFLTYTGLLLVFSLTITLLGVSVSLLTRNATFALILLASFWLLGVFLVPRVAGEASRHLYPAITSVEFDDQTTYLKRFGTEGEGHRDARREAFIEQTLKDYRVSRLEDMPVSTIPMVIEFFEESDGKIMNSAYETIDQTFRQQNRFVHWMSIVSPFVAFRDLSMVLSATDLETYIAFTQQSEAHRMRIMADVDAFYMNNQRASKSFWETIPQFAFRTPTLAQRLTHAPVAILTLLLWLGLALGLMYYSLRTIRVS